MLKEIDTYLDILSGERDFPEIGNECLETCPPDCEEEEHKWHCVYWLRLAPEVAYSDYYYDYALRSIVNNADVYTDGYVGVSRRLEGRYKEHKYEDTYERNAPFKELIEWYGDSIQLLILEEGLSKTKAYEVETSYRPYSNIGWNKAKGGDAPDILAKQALQLRSVCNPTKQLTKRIPLTELDSFLENNPDWREKGLKKSPIVIIRHSLCFDLNLHTNKLLFLSAHELQQELLQKKSTVCTRPLACCLNFIPIDDLVQGWLNYLETQRKHKTRDGFKEGYTGRIMLYTFQKGSERKTMSRKDWAKFFNCTTQAISRYATPKYYLEIDGKIYPAIKNPHKPKTTRKTKWGTLKPILKITHPIYDWEFIKKESTRDYDKRNGYI